MNRLLSAIFLTAVLSVGAMAAELGTIGESSNAGGATVIKSGDGGVVGFCFFGAGGGFNFYCGGFVIVETPSGQVRGKIGPMLFIFGIPVTEVTRFGGVFPEDPGVHPEFAFDCVIPPGDSRTNPDVIGGSCRVSNP